MARAFLIAFAAVALAGCGPRVVTKYVPVEVVREVYVPVGADLTNPHPIATGPVSACIEVAAMRRAELEACNADKAAIRSIESRPRAD